MLEKFNKLQLYNYKDKTNNFEIVIQPTGDCLGNLFKAKVICIIKGGGDDRKLKKGECYYFLTPKDIGNLPYVNVEIKMRQVRIGNSNIILRK